MIKLPLRLALLALAAALALVAAGCGDDESSSGSDADPQEVLDTALGGEGEVTSGVLDISLEADAGDQGSISASVSGPFQEGAEETSLPLLDMTASVTADAPDQSFDFEGGVTLTGDAAYVTYQDTDYEVDDQTYQLLSSSYEQSVQLQEEQSQEGSLAALGIDPSTWLTDLSNEGTEEIDGDEVVRVTGTADVTKILEDLTSIAEQTGQSLSPTDQQGLEQLERAVTEATIDVYANSEDNTLRQLDLGMAIDDPTSEATVSLDLSIGIADPNSEQDITPPEDAQPFDDLLNQIPGGAEALGGLGSIGGAPGGAVTPPTGGSGAASEYYDCVAQAASEDELAECSSLLE